MLALYLLYFTLIKINVTSRLLVKKDTKQKQQNIHIKVLRKQPRLFNRLCHSG